MKLTHEDHDHLTVLSIKGEFTADHTDQFQLAAMERINQRIRDFVLDLGETEFIDSKGLESLVWLQEQSGEQLGQVRLAAANDTVKTILHMTRIASRFDQHEDAESAIKSLRI